MPKANVLHFIYAFTCIFLLCMLVALVLVNSGILATPGGQNKSAVGASGSIASGHYTVITRFLAGPKAGQSEQGTYDFSSNGALTVFFPAVGTGHGTISQDGDTHTYLLTFREIVPGMGDIQVAQIVSTLSKNTFTSQGYGELYINGQPQQNSRNTTISTATLVS